ncbi:hypothetical protein [Streptomyces sp. NPDC006012]|uniref:hypothetical protein n=1 Tax=Streptomyces sp. NPDC006012 TaxID=3364739 RepID=UPI0036815771
MDPQGSNSSSSGQSGYSAEERQKYLDSLIRSNRVVGFSWRLDANSMDPETYDAMEKNTASLRHFLLAEERVRRVSDRFKLNSDNYRRDEPEYREAYDRLVKDGIVFHGRVADAANRPAEVGFAPAQQTRQGRAEQGTGGELTEYQRDLLRMQAETANLRLTLEVQEVLEAQRGVAQALGAQNSGLQSERTRAQQGNNPNDQYQYRERLQRQQPPGNRRGHAS